MTVVLIGPIMFPTSPAYEVKLESFTGPLDLLLHLIRKHEIDISDIPIALITRQYLDYLHVMKELNLSFAGEFLVMAATLLHIKSRTLLPQADGLQEGEHETDDPRQELVRRLVEYQQFKEVAGRLSEQERLWRQMFHRETTPLRPVRDVLSDEVQVFDLLDALQTVLARTDVRSFLDVTPDTVTVQDRINGIIERLEETPTVTFAELFAGEVNRVMVIVSFLALLELVRMKLVRIYQGNVFGPIRMTRIFLVDQGAGESPRGTPHDARVTDGGPDGNGFL